MSTKADLARYRKLQDFGCVCCRQLGFHNQGDVHHLVDRTYRRLSGGNSASVVLCPYHHRRVLPEGATLAQTRLLYGPSLADGSKPFAARWGSQRALLAQVNEAIK